MGARDLSAGIKRGALHVVTGVDKILAAPDNFTIKSNSCYVPAIHATVALLKFCEDHKGGPISQLRALLAALEAADDAAAKTAFKGFYFGAYGSFDWFPPVVFASETTGYVQEVFVSLVERWQRLMELLLKLPRE